MITLHNGPVVLTGGGFSNRKTQAAVGNAQAPVRKTQAADGNTQVAPGSTAGDGNAQAAPGSAAGVGTIAYKILEGHNRSSEPGKLRIKFDALISHDITYVGIIQTARASGMSRFPVPYALTNCHNSLCAVGGTINGDDHAFGLSAAKKYGGVFVPPNQAVIHQYARETLARSGGMILGSDSHTRYGAIGAMGIGEGGPELVKQLLNNTYDIDAPEVVLVWLENSPPRGVGPHDIAIALCGAVYGNGFAKNKILEFAGPGLASLPIDFRFGIDVITTETACLSSIWRADDDEVSGFYRRHGRESAYRPLAPDDGAVYSAMIKVDLSAAEPMIAMPFHPSNAFTIRDMNINAADILRETEREAAGLLGGKARVSFTDKIKAGFFTADQGIIAGCAGGMYDNILAAADILDGASVGDGYFSLSVYPSSMPVNLQLIESGVQSRLLRAGTLFKPCFCGPCFGAGDVPPNNGFSIRHTTRNFMNREGSKPGDGQFAAVALMDARSIAATAANGGKLTAATETEYGGTAEPRDNPAFDKNIYGKRVYNGYGNPAPGTELVFGPNIADWPVIPALGEHMLLRLASVIRDPVTTTDELIPSGEASSYRSNPVKLAGFTLSRRDPGYVGRALETSGFEESRRRGEARGEPIAALKAASARLQRKFAPDTVQIASAVFANKPGDGSAREQAASCQRVLGGGANICYEYATKRYRSNLINWGMFPFTADTGSGFDAEPGDWVFIPDVRGRVQNRADEFDALLIRRAKSGAAEASAALNAAGADTGFYDAEHINLYVGALTGEERKIILAGCLMNYYAIKNEQT